MSRSFVRQTRSKTKATHDGSGNRNQLSDDPCETADGPDTTADDSFVPSAIDFEHGDDHDCAECDRPNNDELYMVQCGRCKRWLHFSCAKVDTNTVRSDNFSCIKCSAKVPSPPASSVTGRSSVSSSRRAQIARELERLEEEKQAQEKVEDERLRMEKLLVEKAMKDKLDREKEYIARKHELLRQQDEDRLSVGSKHSSRNSIQRVEAWVQEHVKPASGNQVNVETNGTESQNTVKTGTKPAGTSTPLRTSGISEADVDGVSIPRINDSVIVGETTESVPDTEKHQHPSPNKRVTSMLSLVNMEPYMCLLEDSSIAHLKTSTKTPTGTIPKILPNPSRYEAWKRQTIEERRQQCLELQRQHEVELERHEQRERELEDRLKHVEKERDLERQRLQQMKEVVQKQTDLAKKYQEDNNVRRKREVELFNKLKQMEQQHVEEKNDLLTVENSLQQQLEMSHQQYLDLKAVRQREKAAMDEDRRQIQSLVQKVADLQEILRQREFSCPPQAAAPQQDAPLESNQSIPHVSTMRAPQVGFGETNDHPSYPIVSDNVNGSINRVGTPNLFPIPPTLGTQNQSQGNPLGNSHVNPLNQPQPNPLSHSYLGQQAQPQINPIGPYQLGPQGQPQVYPYHPPGLALPNHIPPAQFLPGHPPVLYGPTQQQLAARQVIPKDLPIFSGDPIDWPIFISSYKHSTEACGYSDSENLLRLQRSLKGTAKESVSSFLLHPSTVPQIICTLQTLYGRPEQIVHNMVAKVRATPAPKAERLETLVQFGLVVQNLCGHLKAVGMESHLSNPILLQELVDKLPANIKFSWALYQEHLPKVDLNAFGEYMGKVTSATSGVTNLCMTVKNPRDEKPKPKEKAYVNAHAAYDRKTGGVSSNQPKGPRKEIPVHGKGKEGEGEKRCPACKNGGHVLADCSSFKKLSLDERWTVVKENKLCRRCLVSHTRWPCEGEVCGINGCPRRHHQLLHYEPAGERSGETTHATVTIHREPVPATLFKVLPVTLHGKNGSVDTFAFLDDGSSVTLIEQTIADKLGVGGKSQSLCIQWTSGINKKIASTQLSRLEISEPGSRKRFDVTEVYTVENLGLPEQSLDVDRIQEQFKHLRNLPVKSFQKAVPGLLIGLNNSHLLATSKLREGEKQEPIAAKTRIGWTICGSLRGGDHQFQHRQMHICAETAGRDLHDYVQEFFSVENLGVAVAPNVEGAVDQRARRILEETTIRTESGRFETGLIWAQDDIEFPESKSMAERRWRCLEKRLEKDPQLYESVRHQVADFEAKGYIHVVTEEEMAAFDPRRTWYLPLGVVQNPNKPGRIRVIWDAAAKVNGVSLNMLLLKGPDLLTPQLDVTFKFREREVAFSGDIQEMFLQLGIRKDDQSALLFVFRRSSSEPLITMACNVAIFGATCSPAQSQYVKNLNATENEQEFPKAAAAIKKKHYVDDYLDSVDTEEEAVNLALEVAEVHRKAGFRIRNWVSNRSSVLEAIGEVSPAEVKDLSMNSHSGLERVLGLSWLTNEDVFKFNLQDSLKLLVEGDIVPTKRTMLSFVMKIYDPLGLVGSLVIQGKILLQDVWRAKLDWDDRIPEVLFARWKQWLQVLQELDNVRIPRCYFPGYDPTCYDELELHVFVDGSEQAFSAAAYFRVRDRGQIRCSLVSSKTKVAPLQLTSVPRLELQAAVTGARLRKTIEEGHSLKIKRTYFWSDSSTVISWIMSDSRRYRQYVALRVNEILSLSKTGEWRWLGTRINVADEATKWGKGPNCKPDSRWMRGPAFLYREENEWPVNKFTTSSGTEEELRSAYVCSHFLSVPLIDVSRFSKYERLLRCMAYVYRFTGKLLQRIRKQPRNDEANITSEELLRAEQSLWRLAQSESYPDEVTTLNRNAQAGKGKQKAVERTSSIATLSPLLDEHGVLRMDSRLSTANYLAYDARYPVILPRKHPVTKLLLDWYHRKFRHGNNETIVNEVRQRFRIPQLRTQVRATEYRCQWCRVYKSKPETPKMGPHRSCRLTPFLRPFTFVGIDYFGPCLVTVGRASVKRWVAVFTCLTIRAIHLELVYSLTTDSCKKAIRRFIARRGAPQEIYTDNGTNFVGASRELERQIREINKTNSSTFTDANTKWRFNPPSAPHMGGCWERMVRSVKTALGEMPTLRKLDDESFMTLLGEAEHMVNSRPLTYMPLDNGEKESLTPNHFLMLSSSGIRQPVKDPVNARKAVGESWDLIQHMLDAFWHRWILEYLPVISRRTKWFHDVPAIKENTLVLIVDERVRNQWIRGRVIRTYPGKDGIARIVDVQTTSGVVQRPVCKLAVLDVCGEAGDHEDEAVEAEVSRDGAVEQMSERHEEEDVPTKGIDRGSLVPP